MPSHLILIDGSGTIFRSFYALPPMSRSDGVMVNALYGFSRMLMTLLKDELQRDSGCGCAIVFDAARRTFRQDIDPNYKANRKAPPDELIPQFPLIKEAPAYFSLTAIEQEGFEADDIIATLAREAQKEKIPVTIYSSDKDLMQLIGDGITMRDPMKHKTITASDVQAQFGVPPSLLGDALALMGDASDNIKGVPSIGPKSAAALLNQWGDLESLLAHADEVDKPAQRQKLLAHADDARLARLLVTLREDVPDLPSLPSLIPQALDGGKIGEFLQRHEFVSLKKELGVILKEQTPLLFDDAVPVVGMQDIGTFMENVRAHGTLAVAIHDDHWQLAHPKGHLILAKEDEDTVHEQLAQLLSDNAINNAINVIGYHIKDWMHRFDIMPRYYDDIAMMAYVCEGAAVSSSASEMVARYEGDGDASVAWSLLSLSHRLRRMMAQRGVLALYEQTERPLIAITARMERHGICLDRTILRDLSERFARDMAALEKKIFDLARREFVIQSPKQLATVLFDELQLSRSKKGKSGVPSTSRSVLEQLAEHHPLPAHVLSYRHLAKLANTYSTPLAQQMDATSGRIHTQFALTATSTGRLSSLNPNLQNIPIRSEEGRAIRAAFIAPPDSVLIAADYSQIELRLLAHIADVTELKARLCHHEDLHSATAAALFHHNNSDAVTPDDRRRAKAVIFGMIYGISAFGLAKQLTIGNDDAHQLIDAFFKLYPEIKTYQHKTIDQARHKGYVTTLFGRRIHIPHIHAKTMTQRQFSERAAINAPIQGSAADIIKRAMIHIDKAALNATMLLQVHDELLFEVTKNQAEPLAHTITRIMQNAATPALSLSVPLEVSCHIGRHWQEAHG